MPKWSSILVLIGLCVTMQAQDRATLEKERQGLLKQIQATNSLIQKSRKNQQATLADITTIQAEIALRGKVLRSLRSEIGVVESSVSLKEQTVQGLQGRMKDLKEMHAAFIKQEYLQRRTENRTMFLLSASSLNEAYARWRYLRAFKTARERTFSSLSAASDSIRNEIADLETLRDEKRVLLTDVASQEEELADARNSSEDKLNTLKKDESKLRRDLDRQKKERDRLAAEIENIIKAEIAKTTTGSSLPNAPEMVALSAEFKQNQGKLPWPVDRGIITGRFGTQPHPVIPSIKIANNGIDITAPAGAQVKALFNGKVVGKKQIPGFDNTVIVQHGSYYTVYSRLSTTTVALGSEVTTGQSIGQLSSAGSSNGKLHIEVWRDKTQLDPENWLRK